MATTFDTHRLSTPRIYLVRMLVFVILSGLLATILYKSIVVAFFANPGLNGVILAVLAIGIILAFRQVIRLFREVRWVNAFRMAEPGLVPQRTPVLLMPMATLLSKGRAGISTLMLRSILDSVGVRLDESRDISRYLTGLLVFLGLLGTFWGLLDTIQSVGKAISALDTRAADSVAMFDELKNGLAAPLRGMGTAFASSLLGLGGSLILGFLELQANHAHGRFYNQLEEWLSGITDLNTSGSGASEYTSHQLSLAIHDMHRAVLELTDRIGHMPAGGGPSPEEAVKDLAKGVDQLVRQMRAEQKVVREWVDEQAQQQTEVASILRDLASNVGRKP